MVPPLHRRRMADVGRVALLLLAFVLLLPGSFTLPLLDRDEPRFSRATIEMAERGEWVVPYFNNEYRFDKPVLTYWLMRAGYALFGRNELGARAHSIVAAALLAALLAEMARRWWSAAAGMAAGLVFLLTLQVLIHGRAAVADMPMVLCVAASHWALWRLLGEDDAGPRRGWWWLLYLSLGVGFLAKGPVAWLTPAVSLALWRWVFGRRPLPWNRLAVGWGAVVVLAVIAPWGGMALWRTGGAFARVGLGYHVVRRGIEAFDGRRFVPFFYAPTALFSYFPWIAWAGAVWVVVRRERTPLTAFLLSWWLAPYLIFFFYSTQLPHYILPGMPAFFLLLGRAADPAAPVAAKDLPRWGRAWRWFVLSLGGALAVAAAGAALAAPRDPLLLPLRPVLWGMAGMAAGLTWAATAFPRPNSVALTASVVLLAMSFSAAARGLREIAPGPALARLLAGAPADAECLWHRFTEPSVVFYTGRVWQSAGGIEEIRNRMRTPGARIVLARADQTDLGRHLASRLVRRGPSPARPATTDHREELRRLEIRGYQRRDLCVFNVARAAWVTLAVFENCLPAPAAP